MVTSLGLNGGSFMYIYCYKSVIKYYNLGTSPVCACFLDALKAHDQAVLVFIEYDKDKYYHHHCYMYL